ncbi:hypothetical protein Tco_1075805 [Tanacetum coccineum]
MSFLTSIYSLGNIMDEVDIEDLTIKQYLRLTQENQTPKKIEDMTIAEYVEYEKKMNIEEEVEYTTNDEVVMSEQEKSNHENNQNIQHFEEKDDVDKWLNAKITKHLSIQVVENTEDALIIIIKSIKKEMKDDIMKKQIEASTANIDNETSSIASSEVDTGYNNTSPTASCLLPKKLSPGSFLLPFNIDDHNLYAITTLEAKDNIMLLDVYKYLGLDKLRDAGSVENTTRTNEPLGAIDILVKFRTYDVEEEYAKEIGDPYSRRFNEYNRVFKIKIEHLSNEYNLRIGKKGYVLDDVWEKCQQNYKKINEAWHNEVYEEDEMWRIGDEKTEYNPHYVDIETFEVKKYSFRGGRSFICITDHENEALPLKRVNGARFKAMIRKELEGICSRSNVEGA